MNCPKCGSKLDTGYNCTKCDYRHISKKNNYENKIKELIAEKIKYHSNKQKYGYFMGNECIDICASDILDDVKKAGYRKQSETVKEFAQKAISRVFDGITQRFYDCYNDGLIRDYPYSELSLNFFIAFNECKDIAKKEINDLAEQYGKEE